MSRPIPNPTEAEEQRILKLAQDGVSRKDIVTQTGFSKQTVRRTLVKLGAAKAGLSPSKLRRLEPISDETLEQIALLHQQGRSSLEISRATGVAGSAVRRVLKAAGPLKATLGKRIVVESKAKAEDIAALAQSLAVSDAELAWATSASQMMLMPARDLPQEKRLAVISKALAAGIAKVGNAKVEGRSLATELRDVGAYAMQMVIAAPWEEYARRFRDGGVEAMMKYGAKQVGRQETPVESRAIADLLTLAQMETAVHEMAPGTKREAQALSFDARMDKLAQAGTELAAAGAGAKSAVAFREEQEQVKMLRRLARFDTEAFWDELQKERAAVAHLTGPLRKWSEQRLRNVIWEVLTTVEGRQAAVTALGKAVERRQSFGPIPSMRGGPLTRERVAKILFKSGIQPTEALITQIIQKKSKARGPESPIWGVPLPSAVARDLARQEKQTTMSRREFVVEVRRRIGEYLAKHGVSPTGDAINTMLRRHPELLAPTPKTNPQTFGGRLVNRVVVAKAVGAGAARLGPSLSPRRTKRRGNDAFRRLMRL